MTPAAGVPGAGPRRTTRSDPLAAEIVDAVGVAATLRAHGLRRTKDRLAVAALLAQQAGPGHLTAPEISTRLRAAGHPVDRATVYRVLALLVDLGVLHATPTADGATTYGTADHPHHHISCLRCGRLDEVPAQPLTDALRQTADAAGYELVPTGVVLHGTCPACTSR